AGLSIEWPEGTYGQIAARSGLALHHSIDVGAGVLDPDYRGEIKVLLINNGEVPFAYNKGDRIAQ
ncbi:PREDICTED: deoxyuridine 5'-triphosphate nucleotidohydrolase-like, partial [Buceros rhinoceros silvestris]|uniref:deoxyuridine 5'-triphosphate nucleotidohydrolase-like n=1 Tax=Buceros rhinoceros silvestris TaxID=175836 RepID=UPI0005288F95